MHEEDQNNRSDNSEQTTSGTSGVSKDGTGSEAAAARVRREIQPVAWDEKVDKVQVGQLFYRVEDADEARLQYAEQREQEGIRAQREWWMKGEGGKLCMELHAKFQEYKRWLEHIPRGNRDDQFNDCKQPEHLLVREALFEARTYEEQRAERNRKNLEKARQAARCQHIYMDGDQCGAPRLREGTLCRMHQGIEDAKALKLDLGPMEDPDSIQVGIKKLQKAVIDETLSGQQVRQLTNLIQIATWNVTRVRSANRETEEN